MHERMEGLLRRCRFACLCQNIVAPWPEISNHHSRNTPLTSIWAIHSFPDRAIGLGLISDWTELQWWREGSLLCSLQPKSSSIPYGTARDSIREMESLETSCPPMNRRRLCTYRWEFSDYRMKNRSVRTQSWLCSTILLWLASQRLLSRGSP